MPATSSTISLVAGGSDDLDDGRCHSRLPPPTSTTPTPLPSSLPTLCSTSAARPVLAVSGSADALGALGTFGAPRLNGTRLGMLQCISNALADPGGALRIRRRTHFYGVHSATPARRFPRLNLLQRGSHAPDRKCATYGYPSSRYDDRWTALTASNVARLSGPFLAISPTLPSQPEQAEDIPALLQLRHSQIFHGAAFDGRGNYPRRASPWLKTHLLECFYWIQSPQTRTEPLVLQNFSEVVLVRISDLNWYNFTLPVSQIPTTGFSDPNFGFKLGGLDSTKAVSMFETFFRVLVHLTRPKPGLSSILARSLLDLTCSALEGRDYGQITWCILLTRHPHRTRQGTSDFESNSTSLLAGLWCTQTPNLSMERAFDLSRLSSIHSSIGLSATKGRDYLQNINGLLIGPIALSKTETIFNSNEGPLRWTYRFEGIVFIEYMHTFSCLENTEIMLVSHQVQRVNVVDASTSVDIPFSVDSSRLRLQVTQYLHRDLELQALYTAGLVWSDTSIKHVTAHSCPQHDHLPKHI
ncbi:hypothetical protein C8R43DRAFT_1201162 [Mycena crocata]|nr:hypothetical protein C8R43DRAFT_1201162 [Mycena crocata]